MDVEDETSGQKMVSRETRMFEVVQQERPPRRLPLESAGKAVNHGGPDPCSPTMLAFGGKAAGTGTITTGGAGLPSLNHGPETRTSEKLMIPARSYPPRAQVCLRCTHLPPNQRGLALYPTLKARAWVCAEELDVDILGSDHGAD